MMKVSKSTIHRAELTMAVIVMVALVIGYIVSRV